jgi:uncharacterized protein (DUF302 family)
MSESIGLDLDLDLRFDDAIEAVTAALKEEGFGVLTRIDVHKALKEKIGVDFRPYAILGACNPKLAHEALEARPEVGLMLPCNVTVESRPEGGTHVRVVNARVMMETGDFGEDPALCKVGAEADARLRRVAASLGGR